MVIKFYQQDPVTSSSAHTPTESSPASSPEPKVATVAEPPASKPAPSPRCQRCGAVETTLVTLIAQDNKPNGNAGRKYLKCIPCNVFITTLDKRGRIKINPTCDSGTASRLQLAVAEKWRILHHKCAGGACRFWRSAKHKKGREMVVPEGLIEKFAGVTL